MADMKMRDLGRIQWGPTLKLALGRSIASALVLAALLAITGAGKTMHPGGVPGFFLIWSLSSFVSVPIMSLMIKAFNAMFAAMGIGVAVLAGNLMLLMLSFAMAAGDPIIFLLNGKFPALFEVSDIKLFNLQPTIFVLAGEAAPNLALTKEGMI